MVTVPSTQGKIDGRRVASLGIAAVLIVFVALFVIVSVPELAGADESYVVLSDSMSPSIKAGAVVFVSDVPAAGIQQGDVITYRTGSDNPTVTHRVVGVRQQSGQRSFVTKGDANEDPDPDPVPASAVVGEVTFHVPLIGYVVSLANTQLGLVALVVLPAAILIVLEVRDLWRAASEADSDGDGRVR